MRYNYKGFRGCDSGCDIEVQRRNDGKYVFVATEVLDNSGTSVTNFRVAASGQISPSY